mgnify:CR=1 FL=1
MSYMIKKKYSIKKTKIDREKIVNDALAIAMLDNNIPTENTMKLVKEYIDGKKEISDILKEIISYYKQKVYKEAENEAVKSVSEKILHKHIKSFEKLAK